MKFKTIIVMMISVHSNVFVALPTHGEMRYYERGKGKVTASIFLGGGGGG